MRRLLAALISILLLLGLQASAGLAVMGLNQRITNQVGWFEWTSGTDSPEGAFMATLRPNVNAVVGIIPLGTNLPPGSYTFSSKTYDYLKSGKMLVELGGSSVLIDRLVPGGLGGWWSSPVPITTVSSASTLKITVMRSLPTATQQIYLQRGIYITTNVNEFVSSGDAVLNFTPQTIDPTPNIPGNLIENSSFEVGLGHGFSVKEATSRTFMLKSILQTNAAFEGLNSVRIPAFQQLVTRVYRLRGNRIYNFSAWISNNVSASVTLIVENETQAPPGYPPTSSTNVTFNVPAGAWRRVSVAVPLMRTPTADFQCRVQVNGGNNASTWIDALALEEGPLTDYKPKLALELGLVCDTDSHIFTNGQPKEFKVQIRNHALQSTNISVKTEFFSFYNEKIGDTTTIVNVPGEETSEISFVLPTRAYGLFRAFCWVDGLVGVDGTRDEIIMTVMPPLQPSRGAFQSKFGTHLEFTQYQLQAAKRLGINWQRTTSSGSIFRWGIASPVEGVYRYFDAEVALAKANGISILGTIGMYESMPAYAKTNGVVDLTKWGTFASNIISHYRGQVLAFEHFNEPNYGGSAAQYAGILRVGATAVNNLDPSAQNVAFGGVPNYDFAQAVMAALGPGEHKDLFRIGSLHHYPLNSIAALTNWQAKISDAFNIESWNTESGCWVRNAMFSGNSDYVDYVTWTWPNLDSVRFQTSVRGASELLARNVIDSLGSGVTKFFLYDARTTIGAGQLLTTPTIFNYDDSVQPHGIAFGIICSIFENSVGLGKIISSPTTTCYLFDREGVSLAAIWATGSRSLTVPLTKAQLKVVDLMGNPVNYSGILRLGPAPLYLEGVALTTNLLKAALTANVSVAMADLEAPHLSLIQWPTGDVISTVAKPVTIRTLAIDNISLPSSATPDAIQYAFKLEPRDTDWTQWSTTSQVDYSALAPGLYTFLVRARDEALNATTNSVEFRVIP